MIRIFVFMVLLTTIPRINNGYFSLPDVFSYGFYAIISLFCILRGKGLSVTPMYLPFLLIIPLSLAVNDVPAFFRAPVRAVAFITMIITVGPFVYNKLFIEFRKELFSYLLFMMRWIVIVSFFIYLFDPKLVTNTRGFCGLTYQSMLLGPMAGIGTLNYLYWIYISKDKKERIIDGIKMAICLIALILTGSRSALGSCVIGLLFFIVRIYRGHILQIAKVFFVMALLAVSTMSYWLPYTEHLQKKMDFGEKAGSVTASRDGLWRDRVKEFKYSPIFGVGFASFQSENFRIKDASEGSGKIEPGSSWLFLLSSMGVMGFLFCLLPMIYLLVRVFYLTGDEDVYHGTFLASILCMFMAHMIFEGYVVAANAFLCIFLWLLLSECYLCLTTKQKNDDISSKCSS